MRIVLVLLNEAVAKLNRRWVSSIGRMAYAPTTLTQLAALVPTELHAQIEIIDEGVSFFDPQMVEADIIGLSVLTPNAPRAYFIANVLRSRGIAVVMGGQHPTLVPNEAMQYANAIVCGYAETSWPKLLRDFASGQLKKIYDEFNPEDFTNSPIIPRYELLKKHKYILPYTLEATRGCVNKCAFCVISGCPKYNSYHKRSVEHVVNHIRQLPTRRITFLDSSPTEDLAYITSLYEQLIPLKIKWNSSITLKVAEDDEWLRLASMSGCNGVLIGFESLNQLSLTSGNKHFNQVIRYKEAVKKLHAHGITVFACFVFGFDDDGPDVFQKTVDFVKEAKIDILNYTILTPYPGTLVYQKLKDENRIMDTNWEHYGGTRAVFEPAQMSAETLLQGFENASLASYSASSVCKRLFPPRKSFGLNLISNVYFSVYNHLRFPQA